MNEYFFTTIQATILILFAFPMTNLFTENILLYALLFIVIIGSTFFVEHELSEKYSLQEKSRKLCLSLLPINIIVVVVFFIFIF